MANKRIKELKGLSKDEIRTRVRDVELTLFQARMKHATGQLENTASLWSARKDLARLKMLAGQAEAKS